MKNIALGSKLSTCLLSSYSDIPLFGLGFSVGEKTKDKENKTKLCSLSISP